MLQRYGPRAQNSSRARKSQKKLFSAQKAPLLTMTGAYNTVSTNCMPVVAGTMSLDMSLRLHALRRALARHKISHEVMTESESELYTE